MNTDLLNKIETKKNNSCCSSSGCQNQQPPIQRTGEKIGRNDPCFCGNGKKYKKCCGK